MAAPDNLHSHVVSWLKIILPLTALALLSTLFLIARTGDPDATLPFSESDLKEMASEQRVDAPEFAGVTEEGRSIRVSALSATPRDGSNDVIDASQLTGTVDTGDGGHIDITSDMGTVLMDQSITVLKGNVRIVTSTGYTIDTEELTTSMDQTHMETTGAVVAVGPPGTIHARKMIVTPSGGDGEETAEDVSVVFKGGVKLIYVPQIQ